VRVLSFLLEDVRSLKHPDGPDCDADVRLLERNEVLFETGDLKAHLYRVETGALCIYSVDQNAKEHVVEIALAGDVVGMGFLQRHASNARAAIATKVRCFPLDALHTLAASDERAKARFDSAVQREFSYRRNLLVEAGRSHPLARLAAFLIAVSQQNTRQGLDPTLIDETWESAVVADYLGISIDHLGTALVQLEKQGLIQPVGRHRLRIANLGRLEMLSNETSATLLQSDLPDASRSLSTQS
jgi:CRP/FNR family transcriptional regulator